MEKDTGKDRVLAKELEKDETEKTQKSAEKDATSTMTSHEVFDFTDTNASPVVDDGSYTGRSKLKRKERGENALVSHDLTFEHLIEIIRNEVRVPVLLDVLKNHKPKSKESVFFHGVTLAYIGKVKMAKEVLSQDGYGFPRSIAFQKTLDEQCESYLKGVKAVKERKFEDAILVFQNCTKLDPLNKHFHEKCYFGMTRVFYSQKRFEQAAEQGLIGLSFSPRSLPLLKYVGHSYFALKMYEKAKDSYLKFCGAKTGSDQIVLKLLQQCKTEIRKLHDSDYYKVLGLGRKATPSDISNAWKIKCAAANHVDSKSSDSKVQNAKQNIKLFTRAKEVLLNKKRRKHHDDDLDSRELLSKGKSATKNGRKDFRNPEIAFSQKKVAQLKKELRIEKKKTLKLKEEMSRRGKEIARLKQKTKVVFFKNSKTKVQFNVWLEEGFATEYDANGIFVRLGLWKNDVFETFTRNQKSEPIVRRKTKDPSLSVFLSSLNLTGMGKSEMTHSKVKETYRYDLSSTNERDDKTGKINLVLSFVGGLSVEKWYFRKDFVQKIVDDVAGFQNCEKENVVLYFEGEVLLRENSLQWYGLWEGCTVVVRIDNEVLSIPNKSRDVQSKEEIEEIRGFIGDGGYVSY